MGPAAAPVRVIPPDNAIPHRPLLAMNSTCIAALRGPGDRKTNQRVVGFHVDDPHAASADDGGARGAIHRTERDSIGHAYPGGILLPDKSPAGVIHAIADPDRFPHPGYIHSSLDRSLGRGPGQAVRRVAAVGGHINIVGGARLLELIALRDIGRRHSARLGKRAAAKQVSSILGHRARRAVHAVAEVGPGRAVPHRHIGGGGAAGHGEGTARVQIGSIDQQGVDHAIDPIAKIRPGGSIPFRNVIDGNPAGIGEPAAGVQVDAIVCERQHNIAVQSAAKVGPGCAIPHRDIVDRHPARVGDVPPPLQRDWARRRPMHSPHIRPQCPIPSWSNPCHSIWQRCWLAVRLLS